MSQAALARALGVSDMYVSRRLSDGTSLEVADLERIAEVLGVPVSRFMPAAERARDPAAPAGHAYAAAEASHAACGAVLLASPAACPWSS
jgi:Predicted transcriptional regulators